MASFGGLLVSPVWWVRSGLIIISAFLIAQAGFLGHELSHRAFSRRRWLNTVIEQLSTTILCGQTFAYWRRQHGRHHRHAQHLSKDPDLQLRLFALTHEDAAMKRGFFRFTTRWQHVVLWPLVTLQGFSIRAHALAHTLRTPLSIDTVCLGLHYALWLGVPSVVLGPKVALVNYVVVLWLVGPYLAGSFIWNHVGRRGFVDGSGLSFFERQLLGARNLKGTPLYTWLFGGLNFHIEHHLMPQIPSSQLHRVRALLNELIADEGISFRPQGWWSAIKDVHVHVADVARTASRPEGPEIVTSALRSTP
jgi:fatty acid desaturase